MKRGWVLFLDGILLLLIVNCNLSIAEATYRVTSTQQDNQSFSDSRDLIGNDGFQESNLQTTISNPSNKFRANIQHSISNNYQVSGWLPTSWDVAAAEESWENNKEILNEINPVWYKICVDDRNEITLNHGAESEIWLQRFTETKVRVIPMISNSSNSECLSQILKSEEERTQHIQDILAKVDEFDFDGIDIDYEKVKTDDRDLFTIFIAELAAELHERDKILSIAVHPQKTGQEDWDGPGGQDWSRLGGLVDEFKIMAYDHHWLSGDPGPIAPQPWVQEIIDFAITIIPRHKIQLGVPFYAYDWPIDDDGNRVHGSYSRSWRKITEDLCQKYSCAREWLIDDKTSLIKYFSKYDNRQHLLYYENARSLSHRLDLVRENGLGGIAIWRMGNEDPSNWLVINEKLRNNYADSFQDCDQIFEQNLSSEDQTYLTDLTESEQISNSQDQISFVENPITLCHAANKLQELGLLNGDGQGNFRPELPLSRAQLLKIAFVAHNIDIQALPTDFVVNFQDISEDEWFTPYVTRAQYSGWIQGYSDQTFRPYAEITRAEAIKIFLEIGSIQIEKGNFKSWSEPYWVRAREIGLTDPDWQVNENEPMTRGEAALVLARFLGIE